MFYGINFYLLLASLDLANDLN